MFSTITEYLKGAAYRLTVNERMFIIDILNGKWFDFKDRLILSVEDSFNLYPNMYEDKWNIKKEETINKIKSMSTQEQLFLQAWARMYWIFSDFLDITQYAELKTDAKTLLRNTISTLDHVADRLDSTKTAFKSKTIMDCKNTITKVSTILKHALE